MISNYTTLEKVDYFASDMCQIAKKELLEEFWKSIPLYDGSFFVSHPEIYLTASYILQGKKDFSPWIKSLKKYFFVKDFHKDFNIEWLMIKKSKQYKNTFETIYPICIKSENNNDG